MSNNFSSSVLTKLNHKVKKACGQAHELNLLNNANNSFIRSSKLGLENTVNFILGSSSTTLNNELEKYYDGNSKEMVTPGAIVQSRNKIKPELFDHIFNLFNKDYPCNKAFNGYRLLAIDGSDLPIHFDLNDPLSIHKGKLKNDGEIGKACSMLHLNAMYDITNNRFIDYVVQKRTEADERSALLEMARRYDGNKAIFIADRGYEQANLFELLNLLSPNKYLIRIKDITSVSSLFKKHELPDSEFDIDINITFTNYKKAIYASNPKKYKIIQTFQQFDFLDENNHFYEVNWRIVRVKKDEDDQKALKEKDKYELLITNLSRDEFDAKTIKHLYKLRWNIETAFRYLKRSCNLLTFMSRKRELIKQEIIAKLIMYNASAIVKEYLEDKRIGKHKRKHEHKIDFNNAIHKIIGYYYKRKRKGGQPPNLDSLISNKTLPIRPDRSYMRHTKATSYQSSAYRFY